MGIFDGIFSGVLDKLQMEPGEVKIGTWTLMYKPPSDGRYSGKLMVTNRRLCYDAQYDYSVGGIATETLFMKFGSEGYIEIPKNRIRSVEAQKSFFSKRAVVTLDDSTVHIFDNRMLGIDKLMEAIHQRG